MSVTRRHEESPASELSEVGVPARLSKPAEAVLALLVLAALWQEEFPTGRIGMAEVVKYTRLGYNELSTAARMVFLRVREQLTTRLADVVREDVSTERAVLWLERVPGALEDWLYARGREFIQQAHWSRFISGRTRPPETVEAALQGIEETAARVLIVQGRKDEAIARLDDALTRPLPLTERAGLLLARAFVLVRTGDIDGYKTTYRELAEIAPQLPLGDIADRLLKARIQVELAYGQFLTDILNPRRLSGARERLKGCRRLLSEARSVEAGLSPLDQARLTNVEALLDKAEARLARGEAQERLFDQAAHGFRRAFALARTVWDTYGMGAALYNLGELHYVRFRLDQLGASEEQIEMALGWYRASIALGEGLRTNRDMVLDYARVADVLGVFIATRARTAADLRSLLDEAERNLAYARAHGSAVEQRLVRWVDQRLTAHATLAGLERRVPS